MNTKINEILQEIESVIVGKNEIVEKILMAILAQGHVLMEDVPGVGKTTTAMAFAKVLGLETRRVQFTSDTVPSDIIGFSVYDKKADEFVYKPGAIMTNLLLADEINRTSSKTQSALLEAMEEHKVTVDGKAAAVEGYNIDNGNNYYKLRDFASALDVGLTWDKATDTAAIDTGSHYKPDATQLITGNWAPATRARIQAVIDENANQGKYVVFDFDNTSVIFDIQEALLIYQIENLQFKIDPADMEAVLETGIPDLNKSMGTSLDGKNITPATLVADITSDYEWIYANYEGFEGDKDLNYIHASNQYQDFAAKLRFCGEFLDRFGLPVLDEALQADALNYYDQVLQDD